MADSDDGSAPDRSDHESDEPGGRQDHHEHDSGHHHADDLETLGVAVLTVSSSRTRDEDAAGDAIVAALEAEGHEIATRDIVRDAYDNVQSAVDRFVGRSDVDAVVTTGGTGVTPDDVTVEAVEPLFEKRLPGFGELFRRLSYEEIGTRAIATRATAGIADGVPVFCLPGSENAVRLGTEEIVVEVVGHLAGLARQA
ncbi:Molybdopterin biosynthesis enzyme [Halapricum desulfuricans]|uniref:Molybdopterin biosynthesis enzyme n=1 Tax=Halapricum desulfuricans TaxID=2841257 RepID=A0A897NG29_9EURY|nr:molybdenum cofactor biosynthesis protein B [Halapricum desulfuricans]QSG13400.1 Molybdopterin biosynthesis enzyme [Halapricum desulfuricans]